MKNLYIIGAGSVGGHIAANWQEYNLPFRLVGFLDDNQAKHNQDFCGVPVIGGIDLLGNDPDSAVIIGISFPKIKVKIKDRLRYLGNFLFPSLISKAAWVSNGVIIGDGCIIYPGTSVNYGTNIGDFVVMNMNCAVGHDVIIGDYSSLAPGVNLGGHTLLGNAVDLGIGSATKQFVKIHDNAVVGGQAMVICDIPQNSVVAGVPAKSIKEYHPVFT